MKYYIPSDQTPYYKVCTLEEWASWVESGREGFVVGKDKHKDVEVSTVFLGIDHNYCDGGLPILWETRIFGGPSDEYQERYSSLEEAKKGHIRACNVAGVAVEDV